MDITKTTAPSAGRGPIERNWISRRWRWSNVVGDGGSAGGCQCSSTVGCSLELKARLDQMQDRAQDAEGREGSLRVQRNNDVGVS